MIERFVICDQCGVRVLLVPDTEPEDASFYEVCISPSYAADLPDRLKRAQTSEHWCLKCMEMRGVVVPKAPEPVPAKPAQPKPEPQTDAERLAAATAKAIDFVQKALP